MSSIPKAMTSSLLKRIPWLVSRSVYIVNFMDNKFWQTVIALLYAAKKLVLLKNRDKTKLFCCYFLFLELANAFYTAAYLGIYIYKQP